MTPRVVLEFAPDDRVTPRLRHRLSDVLTEAAAAGFPAGFNLALVAREGVLVRAWGGYATVVGPREPTTADTRYDLASLTKVVCTTTLAVRAMREGRWDLDDPLSRWLEGYGRDDVTLRELLTHTSGIIPHRPFFERGRRPALVRRAVMREALTARPGSRVLYSDLNFMLLGWALEACYGEPLDELFAREVAGPLGLTHTVFRPRKGTYCAATELDGDQRPWKELLRGEVHEGLFSDVDDLTVFVSALLARGRGPVFDGWARRHLSTYQAGRSPDVRALGWRLAPRGWGHWDESAIWHTGFTGTSLLVSPADGLAVVLLANAVHPTRDLPAQARFRADVHRALGFAIREVTP